MPHPAGPPRPPHLPSAPTGFDRLYGLELVEVGEGHARGEVAVRDELKQSGGLVHAGVYPAIANSLACAATAVSVAPHGKVAVGLSNQTSYLRPITAGSIRASAQAKHRGRTTWVWEVEFSDDHGRLCALTRTTIAVTAPGA